MSEGIVVPKSGISLSMLCYPGSGLASFCHEARIRGVQVVSLHAQQALRVDRAGVQRLVAEAGVTVSALVGGAIFDLGRPQSWEAARSKLDDVVGLAAALGAPSIYMMTGARPVSRWNDAFAVFADAVGPSVERARTAGVRIAVEPVNWLYSDISFIHTLADAIDLAKVAGTGICLDLFHLWTELRFDELIERAAPYVTHVQLSDYVLGDRSLPARAVPGDGGVPLEHLLAGIRAAGYEGVFDLELSGPRIDLEGHSAAAARGLAWLSRVLT